MEKNSIIGKRRARKMVLQALYQWLMSNNEPYEIEAQFKAMNNMGKVDIPYFDRLLHGIIKEISLLEETILPYIDRPINNLNPIERSTLCMGAFELLYCPEIPYKIILDESVTLTRQFGSKDGFRYVNGVLNNLARKIRVNEING